MTITSLLELKDVIAGPVLSPGDPGFPEEVSGSNLAVSHRPALAVGVTSEADVVNAVRFAAATRLPVRILATGHGSESPVTDGVLLTSRRLDALSIDPAARLARIGAGVRWSAVLAQSAEFGLTAITGAAGSVGAVGYTLGGGLGPLARSHGVSSDYARGFTVVTATGDVVTADADTNPDLFWALRGGKGGLGVVTAMDFELVPLESLYGGSLFFEEQHIDTVVRGWLRWTATADDAVTTSIAILRLPDLDLVPPPLRGKTVVTLRFAYPGDAVVGERLAAPLRALAPTLLDSIASLPAAQVGTIHNDPDEPGNGWTTGWFLGPVDQDFASTLLGIVGPDADVPFISVELRHLGSRIGTDVPEGSAVSGRGAAFSLVIVGVPDPGLFTEVLPRAGSAIRAALAPWAAAETMVNFAGDIFTPEQERAVWPAETRDRLAAVRLHWDPSGVFAYGPAAG